MAPRVLSAVRALVEGLVDYAGLFPPAALGMASAVQGYAAARGGPHAFMLGRFVVTAARLAELELAASALLPRNGGAPWRLSVLAADLASDLEAVAAFNRRHEARSTAGQAVVDVVEVKAAAPDEILEAASRLPASVTAFFEIPIASDPAGFVAALAQTGQRAKVRTGGVQESLFPSTPELARFVVACARAGVPFKATAGLHHPLRGAHALTYAPDSPRATMHGFLNLFLAAAHTRKGLEVRDVEALLGETDAVVFAWDDGGVTWRGRRLERAEIADTRRRLASSFGSCSFAEPAADLVRLGLL